MDKQVELKAKAKDLYSHLLPILEQLANAYRNREGLKADDTFTVSRCKATLKEIVSLIEGITEEINMDAEL